MGFSGQYGTLILYAFHASSVPWFVSCVSILFFTLVTLHSATPRHTSHTCVPTLHKQIADARRKYGRAGIWIRLSFDPQRAGATPELHERGNRRSE